MVLINQDANLMKYGPGSDSETPDTVAQTDVDALEVCRQSSPARRPNRSAFAAWTLPCLVHYRHHLTNKAAGELGGWSVLRKPPANDIWASTFPPPVCASCAGH